MFDYKWIAIRYLYDLKKEKKKEKRALFFFWHQLTYFDLSSINLNQFTQVIYPYNYQSSTSICSGDGELENFSILNDDDKFVDFVESTTFLQETIEEPFLYLRKSTFINFFIDNMIDVPVCFKKSHSLKTKNFELPLLKFSNLLMRQGKHSKATVHLFSALRLFLKELKLEFLQVNKNPHSWMTFYLITTNYLYYYDDTRFYYTKFINNRAMDLKYRHEGTYDSKFLTDIFFMKNYLSFKLSDITPIFSYFIYSVDKNIRKFSRGKSGKYTFIWKYIAPYKRLYLVMRWLIKDVKFYQSKSFNERLIKTFYNLTFNLNDSFAWKSKIFSHNYVFKNLRKTLMLSLKTTR